jgi:hypothetical protein
VSQHFWFPTPCGSRFHFSVCLMVSPVLRNIHRISELHVPSTTWPATFTLKHQGNQYCCKAGLLTPTASQVTEGTSQQAWFHWANSSPTVLYSLKPMQQSGPRTPIASRLHSPEPAADAVAPSSLSQQAGLRAPAACRLGSLCAGQSATGLCSWKPGSAIRPQIFHCPQALFPQINSSCHGS